MWIYIIRIYYYKLTVIFTFTAKRSVQDEIFLFTLWAFILEVYNRSQLGSVSEQPVAYF